MIGMNSKGELVGLCPRCLKMHPLGPCPIQKGKEMDLTNIDKVIPDIDIPRAEFIQSFNSVAQQIEEWADRKGWNSDDPNLLALPTDLVPMRGALKVTHDISKLGLMVTEISEAMEGRRHGDPKSDKIPDFTSQEEELADCIVRIMHYAAHEKLRVAEALVAKLDYNEKRPYKHGKLA